MSKTLTETTLLLDRIKHQCIMKPRPGTTDIEYFIKEKYWFLVAGWKWNYVNEEWVTELHWDYVYVGNRRQGEEVLDCLKSEWTNVEDAERK